MLIECRVNMCMGPITWSVFNPRVKFSQADWIDVFLYNYMDNFSLKVNVFVYQVAQKL